MCKVRFILIFRLLLILISTRIFSQSNKESNEEFVIDYINVRDGLLSNYVTKTVSDCSNLKYFATEGGISRYDGYSFKSYQPRDANPGLLNENIETLFRDNDNNIWIGTKSGGLSMLDVKLDKILSMNEIFNLKSETQLHVMSINQDVRGYIWVGTWSNGVYIIDPANKKLIQHILLQPSVLKIIRDKYDNIWFVAGNELVRYKTSQVELTKFRLPQIMTTLAEDQYRGKIWIVGNKKDVVKLLSFNLTDQQLNEEPISFHAKYIRSIAIDSKKRLWLGSWGDGLFISNEEATEVNKIHFNPTTNYAENTNQSAIIDIEIDQNEIAWLSTAHGGVMMLYPNKGFSLITNDASDVINDHNVISIYRSADNKLLLGTIADGLVMKDGNKRFISISSIPKARVNVIKEHGPYLFFGTTRGLFVFKNRDFNKPLHRFEGEKVTSILLSKNKDLWIGTQQTGLKFTNLEKDPQLNDVKIYSESGKGRYYIENNRINKVIADASSNIWLATYSGLNKLNAETESFITQRELIDKKLPSVIINDLFIKNNIFYVGTPVGFIEMKLNNNKLEVNHIYDKKNGLINDFICALQEDESGNLWLSSTTSITRFDPFKKTFITYDRQDGVMVNSFHIGSSFSDKNQHRMYFGGSNGVIRFNPDSLLENIKPPHIVFTGVIVNNKSLSVGEKVDDRELLTYDINYAGKLLLGYKQNHITLSFAANDFFGTNNVFYQYRSRGDKNDWIDLRNRNELSFTGLNPGDYEIQVRASRDRQNWGDIRNIHIQVDAPPWATWYAYILYFLMIMGVGFLINYISTRQARLEAQLKIAEIEKAKEHDLTEAKIMFFTNISHEFRTPLTLILSPITEIINDLNIELKIREKLSLVENNAKRLLNLINQLLDFRKSEHGLLKLNIERSDFISFSHEVFLTFKEIAKAKGIHYKFHSELDRALVLFDRDKMEIVLSNIISNAFKYSKKGGEVKVHLFIRDKYLNLEVLDNGIGLSPEDAIKVFDRFYQVQSAQTAKMVGSGIGLAFTKTIMELHHGNIFVLSVPEKETTFTVQLLLNNHQLQAQDSILDEIMRDSEIKGYADEVDEVLLVQNVDNIDSNDKREIVLIIDDNEDIRKYLRSLLKEDYRVIEADNGVIGLELAKNDQPDIIISDVMMPEMDGISFCQEIKSHIVTSHIPIILLTARTSEVFEVSGLETGADDYITKPFNPIIMKTRIHNILENRKKLRVYFLNRVRFEPDKQEVSESSSVDESFIEKAIGIVYNNISNEAFGVDILVSELCMSQSTLYRKLKSLTGLSITGFIRSIRLKKAAQMILSDDVKLAQVAFEVGFNDYKYFRVSFQEQFGCLPSDYKAEMMENIKKREQNC